MRVASVNGTRLDTETLAELAGLEQTQMEGYLREALDANVLRQSGDTLEFRHPLLREAAYDDLMPDERTRIHGRLAEILQARVDAEPGSRGGDAEPAGLPLERRPRPAPTLAASVRAGLAAKRLGAAEAVTQFERALSLWDRVPDAEAVAGRPQAELVVLLAEAAAEQDDDERWRTLVRTAVEMLGPDPDRLLASRVYSALVPSLRHGDAIGKQEAIRLAVEYAGDAPTEELARALNAQSVYLNRHGHFAASVEAAERATDAARRAGCVEAEVDALYLRPSPCSTSATSATRLAGLERAEAVGRTAGMVASVLGGTPRAVHGGRTGRSWPVHRRRGLRGGDGPGTPVQATDVWGRGAGGAPVARPPRRGRTAARGAR